MSLQHILLGLLREPTSGYQLKMTFDQTLRHFWAAELSQIYPTLQRMEKERLLVSQIEPSPKGPDRRVYSRTNAGTQAFLSWLSGPPRVGDERFTYLAQVFFLGECANLQQTLRFLSDLRETFCRQLETVEAVEQFWREQEPGYPDDLPEDQFHPHLTLCKGLVGRAASLEWCDKSIRRVEERLRKQRKLAGRKKKRSLV